MGGDFAGLIVMGSSPRSILEVGAEQIRQSIFDQIEAGVVEEADVADILADIDEIKELNATMVALSAEEAQNTIVPIFGNALYYWRDLVIHSFERYVQDVTVPILVMQADRDFQILTDVDFVLFQELLAGRDNVTFRLYEGLNHSFIPTTATDFNEHAVSIMTDIGPVYGPALYDIVDWIFRR